MENDNSKKIETISIENEMKKSYLDYAMSVIVSRALPDVRDGLKPVHRRILWSMTENDFTHDKPYKKSARIVGDVIGKYHPHSDQSIYDALVRMAQPFSVGLCLIDGQGNFGSIDGDAPAAMRYTEAKMSKAASFIVSDIEKETVSFVNNYDNSEKEPVVLPSQFPNILVGGTGGIAVGMATSIPPHNLGEIIDATIALIDNPELSVEDICAYVKGPDFPTGGVIIGRSGARSGILTGRGSVTVRGITEIEEIGKDKIAIIVKEIPYQVNKSLLVEKIALAVREKKIESISALRDESNRFGIRIVIELKKNAQPDIVLNQLYRFSQLQTNIGINILALNKNKPEQMSILRILQIFVDFRKDVVTNRTKFELKKARARAHILIGLAIAVANIDKMVAIIKSGSSPSDAAAKLAAEEWDAQDMESVILLVDDPLYKFEKGKKIKLSQRQIKAILDLRLSRLTALGRNDISNEMKDLKEKIEDFLDILSNIQRVLSIIKDELMQVRENFSIERRTQIVDSDLDLDDIDLIENEEMVVTLSSSGYIKRTSLSTYGAQKRGGKGRSGMKTKEEDFVSNLLIGDTHTDLIFFSSLGICYSYPLWRIPLGSPISKGKAIVNLLPIKTDEKITNILKLPKKDKDIEDEFIIFATKNGRIRRNNLSDFTNINKGGKIAMKFVENSDQIIGVKICSENDHILLTTSYGNSIRFAVKDIRVFKGRNSTGILGIRLAAKDDEVISLEILRANEYSVEERKAYLKRISFERNLINFEDSEDGQDLDDMIDEENENDSDNDFILSESKFNEMRLNEQIIMTITENGYGKRSSAFEFRQTNRGGKGIKALNVTKKTGKLIANFISNKDDEFMLVTDSGKLIRTFINDVRIMGRSTQGVSIIKTEENVKVVSAKTIISENIDDE